MAFGQLQGSFLPEEFNQPTIRLAFERYGTFPKLSAGLLAVQLGIFAAFVGRWRGSLLTGFVTLVVGVLVTALAYSVLPRLYFPGGDFLAWGMWVAAGAYFYVGAWIVTSILAAYYVRRVSIL